MPLEPVKQRVVTDPPTDPAAVPVPIPAESSFWSLPPEEQKRLMADLEGYRRELPRLLHEGQEGKWAVFKGGQLISIHETYDAATQTAHEHFGLGTWGIYKIDPRDPDRIAQLEARAKSSWPR